MDTVGRVHDLIEERGISLFQLSRLSEVSYSTLSNSKRRSGQLSVETIERICGALGITLSEFFAEAKGTAGQGRVGNPGRASQATGRCDNGTHTP
ncbi:MAG: helix-turn-helix transcriptional regulator [Oscillibacter sp.]|nr:helix-turn-helix transcriptional regulator [Oscillibacter sp.]